MKGSSERESKEKESAVFEAVEKVEKAEKAPPEFPPPLDEHLAYQKLAAELVPVLEGAGEQVTIERVKEDEVPDETDTRVHLQEIMEAANAGAAVEGELEKSHEIKDVPSAQDGQTTQQSAFASSVGQVLAQIHQQTQAAHDAFRRQNQPVLPKFLIKLPILQSLSPLYQRALLAGLGTGLVVFGLALLMVT